MQLVDPPIETGTAFSRFLLSRSLTVYELKITSHILALPTLSHTLAVYELKMTSPSQCRSRRDVRAGILRGLGMGRERRGTRATKPTRRRR